MMRVSIIDDNARDAIFFKDLLKDSVGISFNQHYPNGEDFFEKHIANNNPCDVLLIDYDLGKNHMNGVEILRGIKERKMNLRAVILTQNEHQPTAILEALEAGATAYLRKQYDKFKLEQVIRDANDGKWTTYTSVISDLLDYLKKDYQRKRVPTAQTQEPLTNDEIAVLKEIAKGKTNDAITRATRLSGFHIQRNILPELYRKFNLKPSPEARVKLVIAALKQGILRIDDIE